MEKNVRHLLNDWSQEMKYELLSVDAITTSVRRADIINIAKSRGKLLSEQEIEAVMNPKIDWNDEETTESPQIIQLVQTERNCGDVVLTEEERNLIEEFLEV